MSDRFERQLNHQPDSLRERILDSNPLIYKRVEAQAQLQVKKKLDSDAQLLTGDPEATWEELLAALSSSNIGISPDAARSDPFLAHSLVMLMGVFLIEGRELLEEHRIFLGEALLCISEGMSAKDAFHLKAQGRSTELDRDMSMALEFVARLPNEPKETAIIEEIAARYPKGESTIRQAIKKIQPQAETALAGIRAEYRRYKQGATGENT